MTLALAGLASLATFAACGDDSGSGGGANADALIEGCQAYCDAALTEKCGDFPLTVNQCKAQCDFLPNQTKGFCETEAGAVYQCQADGGFTCTGFDTDGDGMDDTFQPVPNSTCIAEQQAYLDCENTAGCKRFCAAAEEEGCGSASCVDDCETKKAGYEMGADGMSCALQYNAYVNCGGQLGVVCDGSTPRPQEFCVDQAFSVAECVAGSNADACTVYCTGADILACGSADCASTCSANAADAACGSNWNSMIDCLSFFGDGACEAGMFLPTADGICSSDRTSWESCKGM